MWGLGPGLYEANSCEDDEDTDPDQDDKDTDPEEGKDSDLEDLSSTLSVVEISGR